MSSHRHLLVIDWDYFFVRPDQAKDEFVDHNPHGGHKYGIYDWSHRESDFHINLVWQTRGIAFILNNLPLPQVSGWRGFADRFKIKPDATVYFSDSNMHAGQFAGDFHSVWLYDAHHDAGYGVRSMDEFLNADRYTCEDWMLMHALHKAKLNWRWPQWLDNKNGIHSPKTRGVKVDSREDDMSTPPPTFDTVFVCRSGAWVPPWCDEDFFDFLVSFGRPLEPMGKIAPRNFDAEEFTKVAHKHAEALKALRDMPDQPPREET